ncbi:hypothetical protein THOG05_190039 [Vibrio rotiferianus]|nr:hypothetical protein THOG05_190039 [Vibrio rotiferianus]
MKFKCKYKCKELDSSARSRFIERLDIFIFLGHFQKCPRLPSFPN